MFEYIQEESLTIPASISINLSKVQNLRMADPLSLATAVIGLVDFANEVAKSLYRKYHDFTQAPREMPEIAHHITFCSGLIDLFQESVSELQLPERLETSAVNHVLEVRTIT